LRADPDIFDDDGWFSRAFLDLFRDGDGVGVDLGRDSRLGARPWRRGRAIARTPPRLHPKIALLIVFLIEVLRVGRGPLRFRVNAWRHETARYGFTRLKNLDEFKLFWETPAFWRWVTQKGTQ
jgi:hypothetical protein